MDVRIAESNSRTGAARHRQRIIPRNQVFRLKLIRAFREEPSLTIIALMAVVIPCISVPSHSHLLHGLKALVAIVGGVVVLGVLLFKARITTVKTALSNAGQNPLIWFLPFIAWSAASLLWSGMRRLSLLGLLIDMTGLGIAFAIATWARSRRKLTFLLYSLVIATLLVAAVGIIGIGEPGLSFLDNDSSSDLAVGTFHDHQLYGSICMILIPVMIGFSLAKARSVRRYSAQAAALFACVGLLVSQHRSAWIGGLVSIITFAVLLYVFRSRRVLSARNRKKAKHKAAKKIIPYAILTFGTLAIMITLLPDSPTLTARIKTMTTTVVGGKDYSVNWRVHVWKGEVRMIEQTPLIGKGMGTYPYFQKSFTDVGQSGAQVLAEGPDIDDEAYDSYLQIAADLGVVGTLLWIVGIGAMLNYGIKAIRRLPRGGLRQRVLMGCVAALVGQAFDAVANPSWQFADVAFYFWIVVGLMVAVTHSGTRSRDLRALSRSIKVEPLPYRLLKGAVACAGGCWLIYEAVINMKLLPAPHL